MWMGIDPGNASGALAIIDDDKPVDVFNMPKTDGEVGQLIRTLASNYKFAGVTVEKVWAGGKTTGTGKATMGVSSAFKFGANFGAICSALSCAGLQYELVAPVTELEKLIQRRTEILAEIDGILQDEDGNPRVELTDDQQLEHDTLVEEFDLVSAKITELQQRQQDQQARTQGLHGGGRRWIRRTAQLRAGSD